jgi:hypothetical protein
MVAMTGCGFSCSAEEKKYFQKILCEKTQIL